MSGVHLERRCDVIIPVKDAVDWVERSVVELLRSTPREELGEVVVVDDRSSPASKKALEEICRAAQVSLVDNTGSKGFGASCNLGASRGTAPYLLLLNSDCLVTPGAVRKLVSALERDPSVAVACPLSNNSPLLTLPLSPGRSYIEMNALLEEAARAALPEDSALEACTIVGNCLLVRRTAWEALGGFDPVWGRGYGEETDLQMRALRRGWRGVCCIDTYVYHQGSASFRNEADLELLQQRNHRLFLERWGEDYARLEARCASRNPTEVAAKRLAGLPGARDLRPDLLFVLPALEQGIGGAQAVVDLCNELLRQGLEARCVVLGSPPAARAYGEMMLSGPLYVSGEPALLAMEDLRPRCCVATHFSTALPVHAFARARGARTIGFVQGLETYFIDGLARQDTIDGYAAMDRLVVTSRWLREGVQRLVPDGLPIHDAPLALTPRLYHPAQAQASTVRVGCTLRGARDKGRAVLLDVLDRLSEVPGLSLTLLLGGQEEVPLPWAHRADTRVLRTPLHRAEIAAALAACDIYVDASLHEGFGLMPLEAMAAGAAVVASDSGGVREYLRDGETGVLVGAVNHAGPYVDAVTRLATDAGRRRTLRAAGLAEAARFAPERSVSAWREALNAVLTQVPKVEAPRALPATPSWLVRPAGAVPRIVLRDVRGPQPGGTRLRLEVTSPSGVRLVAAGRFGALGRRGPNGTLAAVRARGFEVLDRLRVFTQAPAEVDEEVAPGRVSVTLDVPPLLPGEELVLAFPALAAELELSALCLDLPQANGPELLRRVSALRESVLSTGVSLELPAAPGRSRVVRCSLETRGAAEALGRFHGAGAFSAGWETAPAVGTRSLWRHVPEEALRAWIGAASPPERIDCDILILDRPARWSQVAPSP